MPAETVFELRLHHVVAHDLSKAQQVQQANSIHAALQNPHAAVVSCCIANITHGMRRQSMPCCIASSLLTAGVHIPAFTQQVLRRLRVPGHAGQWPP
jgi:hypothetical protein